MRIYPRLFHRERKYLQLNSRLCIACWNCIEACPRQVFGKIDMGFHRHARLENPQNCNGCKACVRRLLKWGA